MLNLTPNSSSADSVNGLLAWLVRKFQVRTDLSATLAVFRGGSPRTGDLWMVPATGGTPKSFVAGLYRSPSFLADGSIVALSADGRIVHLAAEDGRVLGESCQVGNKPVDLIFAGTDVARVGALAQNGRIFAVELAGCRAEPLRSLPKNSKDANQILLTLRGIGRSCKGLQLDTSIRDDDLERGTRREEVILRAPDGAVTTLTTDAPFRFHVAPTFSPDCRQIVYVAADSPP